MRASLGNEELHPVSHKAQSKDVFTPAHANDSSHGSVVESSQFSM